jgi:hypothetical protein
MSYLIFSDSEVAAVAADPVTSHLLFEDETDAVATQDVVEEFILVDAPGQLVERIEDDPPSFVILTEGDQLVFVPPSDDPDFLALVTGTGPKGDKGSQGIQGDVGPESITPGPQGIQGDVGGLGPTGLQGIQGPAGLNSNDPASISFVYVQGSPTAIWNFTHSLGYYPSITVVDSAGSRVEGDVTYVDQHSVIISFAGAFSGTAYLS